MGRAKRSEKESGPPKKQARLSEESEERKEMQEKREDEREMVDENEDKEKTEEVKDVEEIEDVEDMEDVKETEENGGTEEENESDGDNSETECGEGKAKGDVSGDEGERNEERDQTDEMGESDGGDAEEESDGGSDEGECALASAAEEHQEHSGRQGSRNWMPPGASQHPSNQPPVPPRFGGGHYMAGSRPPSTGGRQPTQPGAAGGPIVLLANHMEIEVGNVKRPSVPVFKYIITLIGNNQAEFWHYQLGWYHTCPLYIPSNHFRSNNSWEFVHY